MKFYEQITKVLGGNKKSIEVITGAKLFRDEKENLIISNIKASKKIKNILVSYNGLDLIDITFFDKSGNVIKTENDIYIDNVKRIIEEETQTYFSLF